MTTIDEARANLADYCRRMRASDDGVRDTAWPHAEAIETLLSSYDEMKGRIEEAERLLAPVPGWLAADSNALGRSDDDPFTVKTRWFRALASFVSREKVDGGARG